MDASTLRRDWLVIAATAFLAANLIHSADHVRQEFAGFTWAVFVGGTLLTIQAVVVYVLARRRHPHAPYLATVVGLLGAFLVAAAHIAPHWSVLSASYTDQIEADTLAWVVMLLEITAAFNLGLAGLMAVRARARGARAKMGASGIEPEPSA